MTKGKKTDRGLKGDKVRNGKPGEIPFFNERDYRVFAEVNGIKLKGRG